MEYVLSRYSGACRYIMSLRGAWEKAAENGGDERGCSAVLWMTAGLDRRRRTAESAAADASMSQAGGRSAHKPLGCSPVAL
jgi:hypothetical protein